MEELLLSDYEGIEFMYYQLDEDKDKIIHIV
jgi:hypothetical protein